jgi:3-oxoadipate enol-lactonase
VSLTGTATPYFTEAGFGDCAVLMLHGIGGSHGAFVHQMAPLAGAGYRAAAWDMPGYGFSRSIMPYTFDALAGACVELMDVLEAPRLVLLGHSMGGMVAQQVVALRPERVAGLVLVATSPAFGRPEGSWQREFLASRLGPLEAGTTMAELAHTLVRDMAGKAASADVLATAAELMAGVSQSHGDSRTHTAHRR